MADPAEPAPVTRCDHCGRELAEDESRYIARIQVFAAPGPAFVAAKDLFGNHADEIRLLLERCGHMTAEELMADVFAEFRFTLCRPCQQEYVRRPLGGGPGSPPGPALP